MARITVQSEDLHQQSAQVNSGAQEVDAILTRLTGQIQNLAASWDGAASQAFQERWQEWQTGAQQVRQAMESMGQFLTEAGHAYERTEDELRSAAGR